MQDKEKLLIIEPGKTEKLYLKDLWNFRELLYFLAWRDILVRYKQTVLGIAWSILRPLLTMIVFTIIFGKLGKFPSGGVPYPILVYAAMLPWQFFSSAITESGNSLIANSNLISKVYFPRLTVPISSIIVCLVDFLVAFAILIILMFYYKFIPSFNILFLPFFLIFGFFAALGCGLWLCALNVKYRDFRYVIPFFVQFGLYVSPVGFSSSVIPDKWRLLYSLNPMVGVIDGFRWTILQQNLYFPGLAVSFLTTCFLFLSGFWYFRKTEKIFADII